MRAAKMNSMFSPHDAGFTAYQYLSASVGIRDDQYSLDKHAAEDRRLTGRTQYWWGKYWTSMPQRIEDLLEGLDIDEGSDGEETQQY